MCTENKNKEPSQGNTAIGNNYDKELQFRVA